MSSKRNRTVRTASTLALVVAAACSESIGPGAEPITELPRALSVSEQALIASSNRFGIDLLRTVYAATPDSTVFLSPLSASMALGMTMNGTTGETRAQMQQVLDFGTMSAAEINASYRDLIALLGSLDPRVDFRLANAIFHDDGFAMEAAYRELVQTYFAARLDGLDQQSPTAPDHINAWVRAATANRIDRMVEGPIDPLTVAFLMNAIYFKGDWTTQFDADDTYSDVFHVGGGVVPGVRYMMQRDTLPLRASADWLAADLPYGGGAWAMTVAVPLFGHELDVVLDDLETILDPAAEWPTSQVDLHLPRFELEWERSFNDDLKALGMVDAFDAGLADFTPMSTTDGLHIANVKQKTFLKVDEEGTEAAAVTSVEVGIVCACGPPLLRLDRPFLIAIRERLSGTVLFVGLIVQPPLD